MAIDPENIRRQAVNKQASSARRARRCAVGLAATLSATVGTHAVAMGLNPGGDWQIRWDNTVKYSAGYRLKSPSAELVAPLSVKANADDGDRSFGKGLVSSRADLLSEFDAQKSSSAATRSAARPCPIASAGTRGSGAPACSSA